MSVSLATWMEARRRKSPDRAAVACGEESLNYRELADRTRWASGHLRRSGIGQGDRVAYLGENSLDFVVALFGTVQIGAVFVPLNTRLAPAELAYMLEDSGARLLIHEEALTELVRSAAAPELETLPVGDGGRWGLAVPLQPKGESGSWADPRVNAEDPALMIYTSGTTGRPKGAVLSHGNLTWAALNCVVDYGVDSRDVALLISPLFHVASLGMGALPILLVGGTLVLERSFDPGRALELISRHSVSMMSGVPTTYQMLADHPDWDRSDLSSMNKLTCGGSAVPTRVLEAYEARGLSFSQGYGMTEAGPGVTALPAGMSREKQGSVGLPHFFTRLRIADETGEGVAAGAVGEILIAGPNVFTGYHGLPEATAAAFTDDGWFRTGDLGSVDEDGYLFIAGRLKDMIISGGENVYPAEVEEALNALEGVTGAAVFGVADERWGEVPWAVLTVGDGVDLDTESVRAQLAGRLARYKIPRRVEIVAELPRTASGKLRKNVLKETFRP